MGVLTGASEQTVPETGAFPGLMLISVLLLPFQQTDQGGLFMRRILTWQIALVFFLTWCVPSQADVLRFPGNLRRIEEEAFFGDQSLWDVELPEGVVWIGDRAFGNTSLRSINLPASLEYIADSAFEGSASVQFAADRDTYAYQWLLDHCRLLRFTDSQAADVYVLHGIFEEDEDICRMNDWFACWYQLADYEELRQTLSGEPQWSVSPVGETYADYAVFAGDEGTASLCVDMPAEPCTMTFEVTCSWDGQEVTGLVRVDSVRIDDPPAGTNIPAEAELRLNQDNVLSLRFDPEDFAFGYDDRVGLENYSGDHLSWWEGHDLHIVPRETGDFTAFVSLYSANLYIGRDVVFHVTEGEYPAPENLGWTIGGSGEACLTWDAVPGAADYRVYYSYDSAEWSPGLDWFSCSVCENSDLPVFPGETLRVWVCAVSGDSPQALAYAEVDGGEAPSPEEILEQAEAGEQPGSVFMPEGTLSAIPEELAGNGTDLAFIREYNELVSSVLASDEAYHAEAMELKGTLEELAGALSSVETGEEDGMVWIASGNASYSFGMDTVLELDGSYEVVEIQETAAGLQAELSDGEHTCYMLLSDNGAMVSDTPAPVSRGLGGSEVVMRAPGDLGKVMQVLIGRAQEIVNAGAPIVDGMTDAARLRYCDTVKKMNDLMTHYRDVGFSDSFINEKSVRMNDLRNFRQESLSAIQQLSKLQRALNALGLISDGLDIGQSMSRSDELLEFLEHGHPTLMEEKYPESKYYGDRLNSELRKAMGWNAASVGYHGIMLLADMLTLMAAAGGPLGVAVGTAVKGAIKGVVKLALGNIIDENVARCYEAVLRYDQPLHYSVSGKVSDAETSEPLAGAEVRCEAGEHEAMTAVTDENGMYFLEPLDSVAVLTVSLDDYGPEQRMVHMEKDVPAVCSVPLEGRKGTVTGIVIDRTTQQTLGGVSVMCGQKTGVTDNSGRYTINIGPGDYEMTFLKDGYMPGHDSVTVEIGVTSVRHQEMTEGIGIHNRQELEAVALDPSGNYYLAADISLSDGVWTPLPWFGGWLDGNGRTISGMQVTQGSGGNSGLFAGLAGGKVERLTMTDAAVEVTTDSSFTNAGLLAGNMNGGGTVDRCSVTGTVCVTEAELAGTVFAGGLLGLAQSGTVTNCLVSANVEARGKSQAYAGGAMAMMQSGTAENIQCSVQVLAGEIGGSGSRFVATGCVFTGSGIKNCTVSGSVRTETNSAEALAYGLIQSVRGGNSASVSSVSTYGRAYAVGCQDGQMLTNTGYIYALSVTGRADAAGINNVLWGTNSGGVSAFSEYGEYTAESEV